MTHFTPVSFLFHTPADHFRPFPKPIGACDTRFTPPTRKQKGARGDADTLGAVGKL